MAILEDISEQKRFQEQMQRADRLAAVGEIAAGIAHEINNALAAIFGQTDELDDARRRTNCARRSAASTRRRAASPTSCRACSASRARARRRPCRSISRR